MDEITALFKIRSKYNIGIGNGQYGPKYIIWINYDQQTRFAQTFSQFQSFEIAQTYKSSVLKLTKKNLTHKIDGRHSDELKIILGRSKSIDDWTTGSFEHCSSLIKPHIFDDAQAFNS